MEGMRRKKRDTPLHGKTVVFFFSLDSERDCKSCTGGSLTKSRGDFLDRSKERIFSHIDEDTSSSG